MRVDLLHHALLKRISPDGVSCDLRPPGTTVKQVSPSHPSSWTHHSFSPTLLPCASVQKLPSLVPGINQRSSAMHEMSVVTSLLSIVREEMEKHDVHRLLLVRVRYGALSNIVPEALSFAFEALTAGTDFEGAVLETEEVPITLKCSQCGHTFPAVQGRAFLCAVSSLRRAIRAFNGNGPRAVRPAYRGGIKELIVEIPVIRNVLEANGKLAASRKSSSPNTASLP